MPRLSPHSAFVVLVLALSGLTGCATTYQAKVESMVGADPALAGHSSYWIVDMAADAAGQDLRVSEIADAVRAALLARGIMVADNRESADMIIEASYGIGPPRLHDFIEHASVFGRPLSPVERLGPPPQGVEAAMMGYSSTLDLRFVREKYLALAARENRSPRPGAPAAELWSVHVSIATDGEDLRGHLARLTNLAMAHIGRATIGPSTITLRGESAGPYFAGTQ